MGVPLGAPALPVLAPGAVLACDRLHARLPAADCAARHGARIASGAGRGAIRFHPCGTCPVGARILAALEAQGWTRPPDSLPAVVLEPAQLMARERWRRTFAAYATPDDVAGWLDPLRVAGWLTPDDRGRLEADLAGLG